MRTHETVLDWVESELASHRLVIGGRLPGERAIAEELGVSRSAVREALRVLEAMGVVKSAVGSGPTAGTIVVAEPRTALASALRLHLATDHLRSADIVETRVLLESWAAGHTAPDAEELVSAGRILDRMDDETLDIAGFLTLDAEFHVLLSTASGNPLVGAMMAALRESIRDYTLSVGVALPDWDPAAIRLRAEHRAILAALRAGDPTTASALVSAHIERYFESARPR
jgi:GntR family transcriptional repressor for pyruvate dehydrogenase complex